MNLNFGTIGSTPGTVSPEELQALGFSLQNQVWSQLHGATPRLDSARQDSWTLAHRIRRNDSSGVLPNLGGTANGATDQRMPMQFTFGGTQSVLVGARALDS